MRKARRDRGGSRRMGAGRGGDGWRRKRRTDDARGRALKADVRVRTDQTRIKPRANPWRKRSKRRFHDLERPKRGESNTVGSNGAKAKKRAQEATRKPGSRSRRPRVKLGQEDGGREPGSDLRSAKCDVGYTSKWVPSQVQKRGNLRVGGAMLQRPQRMECKMGLKGLRFKFGG